MGGNPPSGAVPDQTDAFYFAFVNYTTLGYGDILPVEHWRLLGPMTAMNGVLLFGWSTAVIFHILSTVSPIRPGNSIAVDADRPITDGEAATKAGG